MQLERVEERKAMWYRVPEAPWVRSELEGLSQSPIDHGIQPVHDPMTLTIKLRKTRARAGKKKKGRGREREKKNELDPVTVNSARGFMAVRRRRITPVVSRYILKSRAHACKSRTKLRSCADEIKIVEKSRLPHEQGGGWWRGFIRCIVRIKLTLASSYVYLNFVRIFEKCDNFLTLIESLIIKLQINTIYLSNFFSCI